jgi:enediyne biosynthesis thioesterase
VVSLEETNLVGNVYFVNHLRWQGRCREMFLRDHAPSVLDELAGDLALVTTHAACDYHAELKPFEDLAVRMYLERLTDGTIGFRFEYWRQPRSDAGAEDLVATGVQTVACMRRSTGTLRPTPVPGPLRGARTVPVSRSPVDRGEPRSRRC